LGNEVRSVVKNFSLTVPVIAVGVTSNIARFDPDKGEQMAQAYDIACFRQL
jgi:hypothetical protein